MTKTYETWDEIAVVAGAYVLLSRRSSLAIGEHADIVFAPQFEDADLAFAPPRAVTRLVCEHDQGDCLAPIVTLYTWTAHGWTETWSQHASRGENTLADRAILAELAIKLIRFGFQMASVSG